MLKKFKINIVVRVLFISLVVGAMGWSVNKEYYLTAGFLTIALVVSITNMIYYVNQTNRDLANFLAAIKYEDFVTNSSGVIKGESFGELHSSFNLINSKFRDIRAEKEANHQFLQTLVEHIEIGLLCCNKDGEVILMNKALQQLLHKSYLINIKSISKIDEKLWEAVNNLEPGNRALLKLNIQNQLLQLSIQSVNIKLQNDLYTLYSFQNIQTELEAQELIAWQKLIRILTHEIMNSVAPITSLSATMSDLINKSEQLSPKNMDLIKQSISVIKKRSEGLLDFTETYRTLTRIPPPKFRVVNIKELIEEVQTLFAVQINDNQIKFEKRFPDKELACHGDPHLLEQVLINLIKNAIEAIESQASPKIVVTSKHRMDGKTLIQIFDNGPGIPKEKMDQIFIPFFTTKQNGSGIGLSLSRQIIRMHKGTIEIQSEEGAGTMVNIAL